MTKILVVSDTHYQEQPFADIIHKHKDIDYKIHCGDSQWLPNDPRLTDIICVRGNNDVAGFGDDYLLEIAAVDIRILITHGHRQYVYHDGNQGQCSALVDYAIATHDANIVFYGHTHVAECHIDRDIVVLNPGSTNFPRSFQHKIPTYAIVTLEGEAIHIQFFDARTHEEVTKDILG